VGNCIGRRNYVVFVRFLSSVVLLDVLLTLATVSRLRERALLIHRINGRISFDLNTMPDVNNYLLLLFPHSPPQVSMFFLYFILYKPDGMCVCVRARFFFSFLFRSSGSSSGPLRPV
jgi:hypothetical protein